MTTTELARSQESLLHFYRPTQVWAKTKSRNSTPYRNSSRTNSARCNQQPNHMVRHTAEAYQRKQTLPCTANRYQASPQQPIRFIEMNLIGTVNSCRTRSELGEIFFIGTDQHSSGVKSSNRTRYRCRNHIQIALPDTQQPPDSLVVR